MRASGEESTVRFYTGRVASGIDLLGLVLKQAAGLGLKLFLFQTERIECRVTMSVQVQAHQHYWEDKHYQV